MCVLYCGGNVPDCCNKSIAFSSKDMSYPRLIERFTSFLNLFVYSILYISLQAMSN